MEVDEDGDEDARLAKATNSASTKAWFASKGAGPSAPGSKEIPDGKENCLAGLKLVFTGELSSMSREEATELAKRYGAQVTTAPSGATSYVVLGDNAGPSKLAKIKSIGIKTLDEDGFLNLIGTRKAGHIDEKTKKKLADDKKKIKAEAERMEEEEAEAEKQRVKALRQKEKAAGGASQGSGSASSSQRPPPLASSQLWTTKYAPSAVNQICGNKTNVERLIEWLNNWSAAYQCNFKKPGKNATGTFRAILISGPPGIGKTTAAHIVAVACGYTPLELNASDARSKKLIQNGTNIDNSSLDGWFAGSNVKTNAAGVEITHRTCLIMDEVDGMSGGDRGGVGAMNALVKKTKIPIILICNDKGTPKMKPLIPTTFQMPFRRPSVQEIRSRIMSICFKEKLKIPANVVDQLINGSNSDIRQVLNMLSTWKLSSSEMNFDDGKQLAKANEKNTILSPFDICNRLFSPYMFSATSRTTLSEKMDLYFQDFSFVPLFMQDNYPKQTFARAQNLVGPEKALKTLQLMSEAADSISIGDNIDRMIHSNDQQWSLLPAHAVMSTVRPAYFTYGQGGGWGGQFGMAFPQWLGQNSKQTKMSKLLNEIQIHMRLKVSANTTQIRQHYLPTLFPKLVEPLMAKDSGSEEIASVIETMDEYYLDKEDWDALVELGVGDRKDDGVLKKIPSTVKAGFTRTYNKSEHPIAFHKGVLLPTSKIASGPKADQEDVHEEEEVADSTDDDAGGGDEGDVSKDSLIKKPKAAKGKGKAAATTSKAKPKAAPKKTKK
ncbi:replication factor RFC1 C terminal domain-containing protein [Mrakia frigida]|uniref:replication factor C subunit 1 n=1 Tax=Mrakia frigida TaxID=29902 RepID=UPI003FCC232B